MNRAYGFKVTFNDEIATKAGIEKENYVVTACATIVHRNNGSKSCNFNVGGLDSNEDNYLDWFDTGIKLGDIIEMEVIDSPFDPPVGSRKFTRTPEEKLQNRLEEYYYLKEKLKDYINK